MKSTRYLLRGLIGAAILLGAATAQPTRAVALTLQSPAVSHLASAAELVPAPPRLAAGADEVQLLRTDLHQILRGAGSSGSVFSVLVVSLDRADTLFSLNPDLPVAPASNMKLFTTAAALFYLGPNFRYSTYALADGEVRDGILEGDVVLYGTGDPAISSRMLRESLGPLRALADSLKAQGIREIRGDVVGDGSYFDDQWIADGWREQYRLDAYSAPIGALSLSENIVTIRVLPGASAGSPARITTTPETDGLLVHNRVETVASGTSSVRFTYDPSGLVIEGRIARKNRGVARTVTVVDPANLASAAFRSILEDVGIRVGGEVRTIRSAQDSPIGRSTRSLAGIEQRPPPRVIGTHLSPTLAEMVTVANHVSQNLYAEAFFKTVGRVALGDGSFAGGARAVELFLSCEKPLDLSQVRFADGSGLSPIDRVTARAMIHLLDLMTRTDVWEVFHESLPEAASTSGPSHTLRNRMGGTAAAKNLRAKTGTIASVSSLSGYVTAANGERLAFTIFGNDLRSTGLAKGIEDRIGARLARFTRPGSAAGLATTSDPGGMVGDAVLAVPGLASTPATSQPASPAVSSLTSSSATGAPVAARPPTASPSHRVVRGETLDAIARRYGTSVAEIQRLNPQVQPRRLLVGQRLKIPAR